MGTAPVRAEGPGLFTGAPFLDLQKALRELYDEKKRMDGVISSLEQYLQINGAGVTKQKRGRKSMGPEERGIVSARMRGYWATRRTGTED